MGAEDCLDFHVPICHLHHTTVHLLRDLDPKQFSSWDGTRKQEWIELANQTLYNFISAWQQDTSANGLPGMPPSVDRGRAVQKELQELKDNVTALFEAAELPHAGDHHRFPLLAKREDYVTTGRLMAERVRELQEKLTTAQADVAFGQLILRTIDLQELALRDQDDTDVAEHVRSCMDALLPQVSEERMLKAQLISHALSLVPVDALTVKAQAPDDGGLQHHLLCNALAYKQQQEASEVPPDLQQAMREHEAGEFVDDETFTELMDSTREGVEDVLAKQEPQPCFWCQELGKIEDMTKLYSDREAKCPVYVCVSCHPGNSPEEASDA